jgi:hypothetical protein
MSPILLVTLIVGVLVDVPLPALLLKILLRREFFFFLLHVGISSRTFRTSVLSGDWWRLRHGAFSSST